MKFFSLKHLMLASLFLFSLILVVIASITFFHNDFIFTSSISNIIFNLDHGLFYSACLVQAGECNYFPTLYYIFAIWNLPLYIFDELIDTLNLKYYLSGIQGFHFQLFWDKLLIILFSIFSALMLQKIDIFLSGKKANSSSLSLLFASSPFFLFTIFIFTGYDIVILFFLLSSLFFYLRKNFYTAFFLFSITISMKFFTLYLCLLLLALFDKAYLKKKIIAFLFLISFIPVLEIVIYMQDDKFFSSVFALVENKVYDNNSNIFLLIYQFFVFFVSIFFIIYLFRSNNLKSFFLKNGNLIFLIIIGFLPVYLIHPWSPQWLILFLPFVYLVFIRKIPIYFIYTYEILLFLLFIFLVPYYWFDNVDNNMTNNAYIETFRNIKISLSDLFQHRLFTDQFFLILYILLSFFIFLFPLFLIFIKDRLNNIYVDLFSANIRIILFFVFYFSLVFISIFTPLDTHLSNVFSSKKFHVSHSENLILKLPTKNKVCQEISSSIPGRINYLGVNFLNPTNVLDKILISIKYKYYEKIFDKNDMDNNILIFRKEIYLPLDIQYDEYTPINLCYTNNSGDHVNVYFSDPNNLYSNEISKSYKKISPRVNFYYD